MEGESFAFVLLAVARWITYLGLVGLTGAVACRGLLPAPFIPDRSGRADQRRLVVIAGGSAVLLVLGAAARLYAQTWSVFGLDEPVTAELMRVIGVESRWGASWRPQAAVAGFAAAAAAGWAWQPRIGWWMTAVAAAGAWVTLPLTGHATSFGTHLPWIAQTAHGIGAGLWVGTLAVVVAVSLQLVRGPEGHRRVSEFVRRFSPLAVAAVATIIVSGVFTAVLYLDAARELWTTAWGRTLVLKVALFAATGMVGAYNWRRLLPRLGDAPGTAALLRSARLELALAMVVLAVAAVLVHLAMPGEVG